MKWFKRIFIWMVIGVIIQQGIFLYIENIYMATDLNIEFTKDDEKLNDNNDISEIKLESDEKDVLVSSNGRFVSYIEDEKLSILDSNSNEVKEAESNGNIMFYKWVTNSTRIIAVQKIKEKGKYYFEPVAFEGTTGEAIELADFDLNKLRIPVESSSDKIDDIVFSIGTHSLYIKVKKSNGLYDLYTGNTMNQLDKSRSNKDIGNIVVPTTGAKAVMEMGSHVTKLDSPDNIDVSDFKNPKVLGADINDNIYFGEEVDGKITRICYTVASQDKLTWKEIKMKESAERKDIIVDYSGRIYINNNDSHRVLELVSNKTIEYKGEFLQVYSKGIISRYRNKLIKNTLQ